MIKNKTTLYPKDSINYLAFSLLVSALSFVSCKKLVEVPPPPSQLVTATTFSSNGTATSALVNIYKKMFSDNFIGSRLAVGESLYADELVSGTGNILYYKNTLTSTSGLGIWNFAYNYIYQANAIMENILDNPGITAGAAKQIIGECKLIRAFSFFYIVNEVGAAPLATTTDYTVNGRAARAPVADLYRQMITDLTDAKGLLSSGYVDASDTTATNPVDKQRPPKWAATAMLARCYLYTNKYDSAEAEASMVINQSSLFRLTSLDSVFLKNSGEAIWQIGMPLNSYTTSEGGQFIGNGGTPTYTISPQLLSAFESGDLRRAHWVGTYSQNGFPDQYYPFKYKAGNSATTVREYTMMLRLAEQYLIRAEARAQQGNLSGAASDLNAIRNRAGLSDVDDATASSQAALLAAIQHERQVELFTEWGHRWFDLKRTGAADSVMSVICPLKGGQWASFKLLFPIPNNDIIADNNLIQNPGY